MEEREIHLRDYLRVVNKRKSTVVTFFVVTFLLTLLVVLTKDSKPVYRASTKALIEKNLSYSLTGRQSGSYGGYDPEFLQTQTQIIRSEGVAEEVVASIGAEKMYNVFFPDDGEKEKSASVAFKEWLFGLYQSFKEGIGIQSLLSGTSQNQDDSTNMASESEEPPSKEERLKSVIRGGISVTPIEGTRVVSISYTSPNPVLSRKIANSVAKAYIDELLDKRMEASGHSIEWMKKKAEVQREKLEKAEQRLHQYKKDHNIVTIEDRLAILPERLSELSAKLTRAETKRKELESVYHQVKDRPDEELESLSVISDSVSVDSINQKILTAEEKVSELSKKYGRKHPKMISAKNKLKELKTKKHKVLQNAVKKVKNEFFLAKSQEDKYREMLNETKSDAELLNEKSIQLDIIKRRVDTNKYLYDALIKRMEEKGLTEQTQLVNVWVIEKAKTPQMALTDDKKRNILLGLILGLFGGVGLAFFFEYLDNTVKTPEDVEIKNEVPVIGTIDLLKDKNTNLVETVLEDRPSNAVENFKSLRTSILLSSADKPPQVLLVTSMAPKDGKSTIAFCLALSMARAGRKVLLVDGDMRRPQIQQFFNLNNSSGLSSYLAGDASGLYLHKGVEQNLDVMTSGPVPPNPSELLSSSRADKLIEKSKSAYDTVIIDAPPLGVTDPLILSRTVDGVLLVASAGDTKYEMLDKGVRQLTDVSAKITGVVLNRFDAKRSGYYYNYGDYYYSSETG
ncbi:MAG: polysaccharide biosynthesis tyrosine autokinase [Desulfobacteraceae bacterium]